MAQDDHVPRPHDGQRLKQEEVVDVKRRCYLIATSFVGDSSHCMPADCSSVNKKIPCRPDIYNYICQLGTTHRVIDAHGQCSEQTDEGAGGRWPVGGWKDVWGTDYRA